MAGSWKAVGAEVLALRDQSGLTQAQLSERSAVSIATIRNAERAEGKRSRRTLEDLSTALGKPKSHLGEVLAGRKPAATIIEDVSADPGFVERVDEILIRRLTELVIPHLNQIERKVSVRPDILHTVDRSVEVTGESAHEGDSP